MMLEAGGSAMLQASVIVGCLLLMAYPALRIIGMYLEQQISGVELLVYFGVALGFVMAIMKTWGSSTSWLLGILYVVLCGLYPLFENTSNARALRRMDDEEIARCQAALDFDPKNASALGRMGDIYYARGELDRAIECYERSLELARDARVKFQLRRATQRKRLMETGNVVCFRCGTENPRGTATCAECGTAVSGRVELLEHVHSPEGKRTLLWVVGGSLLAGVVLLFVGVAPAILRNLLFLLAFAGLVGYGWIRSHLT